MKYLIVITAANELIEKHYEFTTKDRFTLDTALKVFTEWQVEKQEQYKRAIEAAIVSCEFAMDAPNNHATNTRLDNIKAYLEELL